MEGLSLLQQQIFKLKQVEGDDSRWSNLPQRKIEELKFHNMHRDKDTVSNLPSDTFELLHGNIKYYATTDVSRQYVNQWIAKEAKGKIFLDYACGNGSNAMLAAKSGAQLAIGMDISNVSVNNCRQKANELGLSNTEFVQGDCENTNLPNNSVDVIICSGMLHHLDLSYAFPELRRILKPGGRILAVEALNYNPLIKIYRMRTPSMRTEWEKKHILSLRDLKFADRFFEVKDIRYWHPTSYLAGALHRQKHLFGPVLAVLNSLDRVFTKIPLLQLMAWQFTFVLEKRRDDV